MLSFTKIKPSDFDYIKTSDSLCNHIFTDCLLKIREEDTCVYFHYRKDDDIIFYVGIGGYDRPYWPYKRSKWWHSTVKKHGYTIKVVHSGLSWQEACKLEIFYILKFGRLDKRLGTLVNLTDGGDGAKGYFLTEEQRLKKSLSIKKSWQNSEIREKRIINANAVTQTPEFSEKISEIVEASWKNPEIRENRINAQKEATQTPEFSKKISLIVEESWKNPEIREKRINGLNTATQTDEFKNKISEISTKMWANMTPEQKIIRGQQIKEGRRKNKINKK